MEASSDLFHFGDVGAAHDVSGHLASGNWTEAIDADHLHAGGLLPSGGGWTSEIESNHSSDPAHPSTPLGHDDHATVHTDQVVVHLDHIDKHEC